MPKQKNNHPFKARRKPLLILLSLVVVALVAGGIFYAYRRNTPKTTPVPSPTITSLPAQPAANDGEKKSTPSSTGNDGTAKDNQGQISAPITTSPGQWTRSASGVITVKQPIAGATISSGVELAGSSTASKIEYRLVDDQVGVISRGFINVVSGNFSANISFNPKAKTGRLDVFTADDNGVESNEVQILVKF